MSRLNRKFNPLVDDLELRLPLDTSMPENGTPIPIILGDPPSTGTICIATPADDGDPPPIPKPPLPPYPGDNPPVDPPTS